MKVFENTDKGNKLPIECLEKIQENMGKSTFYKKNKCVVCSNGDLTYDDYLDGVGYICTGCLF